jgi:Tfp pilus assembly protein FimT
MYLECLAIVWKSQISAVDEVADLVPRSSSFAKAMADKPSAVTKGKTMVYVPRVLFLSSRQTNCAAFTLLEIMMVVGIIILITSTVTFSVRERWAAEQARRSAQKIVLACMRAKSTAWREGREWELSIDPKASRLVATPVEVLESQNSKEVISEESEDAISTDLDPKVTIFPESEGELEPMRFLPNGRVRSESLIVKGPKGDSCRVSMDWVGNPILEQLTGIAGASKKAEGKKRDLKKIEIKGKESELP